MHMCALSHSCKLITHNNKHMLHVCPQLEHENCMLQCGRTTQGHQQKKDVQSLIDRAQAQIWEQKVSPAVQGDFGISSLSRIRQRFQDDAEVLRLFYE